MVARKGTDREEGKPTKGRRGMWKGEVTFRLRENAQEGPPGHVLPGRRAQQFCRKVSEGKEGLLGNPQTPRTHEQRRDVCRGGAPLGGRGEKPSGEKSRKAETETRLLSRAPERKRSQGGWMPPRGWKGWPMVAVWFSGGRSREQ